MSFTTDRINGLVSGLWLDVNSVNLNRLDLDVVSKINIIDNYLSISTTGHQLEFTTTGTKYINSSQTGSDIRIRIASNDIMSWNSSGISTSYPIVLNGVATFSNKINSALEHTTGGIHFLNTNATDHSLIYASTNVATPGIHLVQPDSNPLNDKIWFDRSGVVGGGHIVCEQIGGNSNSASFPHMTLSHHGTDPTRHLLFVGGNTDQGVQSTAVVCDLLVRGDILSRGRIFTYNAANNYSANSSWYISETNDSNGAPAMQFRDHLHNIDWLLTGAGAITSSDDRVKHNEQAFTGCLDIVDKLVLKSYTMSDAPNKKIGFIAQEVETIEELKDHGIVNTFDNRQYETDENGKDTSVVKSGYEDSKGLNYDSIHSIGIGAIKELLQRVKALESEVAALKATNI